MARSIGGGESSVLVLVLVILLAACTALQPSSLMLTGYRGAVFSARFHPSGLSLLTAGADNILRVWEMATGRQQAAYKVNGVLRFAEYSPDGTVILALINRNRIHIYNTENGSLVYRLGQPVMGYSLSPDGYDFLTYTADGVITMREISTGQQKQTLTVPGLTLARYNPDGSAIVTLDGKTATLFDVTSGAVLAQFEGHFTNAHFTPNSERLFTIDAQGSMILWHIPTRRPVFDIPDTIAVYPSFNGIHFARLSRDHILSIHDIAIGTHLANIGSVTVNDVFFSPTGSHFATATPSGIIVWDVGKLLNW